eukprot:201030-Rhodomonas_salina.1
MLNKLQSAASVNGSVDLSGTPLKEKYSRAKRLLCSKLKDALQEVSQQAEDNKLYAMAIEVWTEVKREIGRGLKNHVSMMDLGMEAEFERMTSEATKADETMKQSLFTIEHIQQFWEPKLSVDTSGHMLYRLWYNLQYRQNKNIFSRQVAEQFGEAEKALQQSAFSIAGQKAAVLQHICSSRLLLKHLESDEVLKRWKKLCDTNIEFYRISCKKLKDALKNHEMPTFESRLRLIHAFEVGLYGIDPLKVTVKSEAQGVHQAISEWVKTHVAALESQLNEFKLEDAAESMKLVRDAGKVLVSTFALYIDVAEADKRHSLKNPGLGELHRECTQHFGFDAVKAIGVHFAMLQLDPSATLSDVKSAFKTASLKHHPDKEGGSTAMQQRVNNAHTELSQDSVRQNFKKMVYGSEAPFSKRIKAVPTEMLRRVKERIKEREYDEVSKMLSHLDDLSKLMSFADVSDRDVKESKQRLQNAIKDHMKSLRANVQTLWSKREYRLLNEELCANERADKVLAGHAEMYDRGWSREIREQVEKEIEVIATRARSTFLGKSERKAEIAMDDFALQLIYLGRILDDLPQFKSFCKQKMTGLLDMCHDPHWGHGYIFRLGILLGQGTVGDVEQEGSEDERIGKTIVSEFKHFKVCCRLKPKSSYEDVNTLVWNEEVTKKDVEEIANEAEAWEWKNQQRFDLPVAKDTLTKSYKRYEKKYNDLFDEWVGNRLKAEELAVKAKTE